MNMLIVAIPILFQIQDAFRRSSWIAHPSVRLRSALRYVTTALAVTGLVLGASLSPGLTLAQEADQRAFDTGYTIVDDAVWNFYNQYGGSATFGEPISREFPLMGAPVQLFQDAALQVQPDGAVQVLPLTAPGLLPYTHMDGLSLPAADPALAFITPSPEQPNYAARLDVFVHTSVPDSWNGQAVQFWSTYAAAGGPAVWGLPTSAPRADLNNPHFVYQRFQNGILLYDSSIGTTQALQLGNYLKDLLTGQNLPADLAGQAAASPLLRAGGLTDTDLTDAFLPDAA